MAVNKNHFQILYQDEHLIAIDKPAGFSVHPPQDPGIRISKKTNCLGLLRDQTGQYLYPVHRLDRATTGVLLYAFTKPAASELCRQFAENEIQKTYIAVIRGWMPQPQGELNKDLKSEDGEQLLSSSTSYDTLAKIELPFSTHEKFATTRYSLIEAKPHTGRRHQIRRHFNSSSHPLIGDTRYGSRQHNKIFSDNFGVNGLMLRACAITLKHPITGTDLTIRVQRWRQPWYKVFDLFGYTYLNRFTI